MAVDVADVFSAAASALEAEPTEILGERPPLRIPAFPRPAAVPSVPFAIVGTSPGPVLATLLDVRSVPPAPAVVEAAVVIVRILTV